MRSRSPILSRYSRRCVRCCVSNYASARATLRVKPCGARAIGSSKITCLQPVHASSLTRNSAVSVLSFLRSVPALRGCQQRMQTGSSEATEETTRREAQRLLCTASEASSAAAVPRSGLMQGVVTTCPQNAHSHAPSQQTSKPRSPTRRFVRNIELLRTGCGSSHFQQLQQERGAVAAARRQFASSRGGFCFRQRLGPSGTIKATKGAHG